MRLRDRLFMPPRFQRFHKAYSGRPITILDIGCGNHSPSITKRLFPLATYHGVDRDDYNLDAEDRGCIDQLHRRDLDREGLAGVPDDFFDVVILSHVIEHLQRPEQVLAEACAKLKAGGALYVEFPSLRSLGLPSMEGTLQFCDDPTHINLPDPYVVANVLLRNGVSVRKARHRRNAVRLLAAPFFMLRNVGRWLTGRRPHSRGLWDVTGFAFYFYGVKRPA